MTFTWDGCSARFCWGTRPSRWWAGGWLTDSDRDWCWRRACCGGAVYGGNDHRQSAPGACAADPHRIRFSLGAGEAVIYPASNQFVAKWIPVAERGRANGWIFAGVGAGAGLSIPMLNWITGHYGWRASFWFSAAAGLAVGLVWYWMARDTPEEHPLVSREELAYIQANRSRENRSGAGIDPRKIRARGQPPS